VLSLSSAANNNLCFISLSITIPSAHFHIFCNTPVCCRFLPLARQSFPYRLWLMTDYYLSPILLDSHWHTSIISIKPVVCPQCCHVPVVSSEFIKASNSSLTVCVCPPASKLSNKNPIILVF
jgi:hypothetical protein